MKYLALYLVLHLPFLAICYVLWIQHERGGVWKLCHVFGILGYLPDVVANHTTFAFLFWRKPESGAWTFSQQLGNLVQDDGWRGVLARRIAAVLDRIAPSGKHITP